MNKPLQKYIEEEVKLFEEKFVPLKPGFSELKDWTKNLEGTTANYMTLKDFLSQSLHRIAKITAKAMTIEKLKPTDTDFPGYKFAIRDLKNKKEQFFG